MKECSEHIAAFNGIIWQYYQRVVQDMFLGVAEGFYLVVRSEGKINENKPRTF